MSDSWATPAARHVRHEIFSAFAAQGRAPSPDELAAACELDPAQVREALRELHDKHAIVLSDAGDSIRMAHPFSAWPMGFAVRDGVVRGPARPRLGAEAARRAPGHPRGRRPDRPVLGAARLRPR